jgi:hypothetical protein
MNFLSPANLCSLSLSLRSQPTAGRSPQFSIEPMSAEETSEVSSEDDNEEEEEADADDTATSTGAKAKAGSAVDRR